MDLKTYQLTRAQREIRLAAEMEPDASCAFNEAIELVFENPVREDILNFAVFQLVLRHDALRSRFGDVDAESAEIVTPDERPDDPLYLWETIDSLEQWNEQKARWVSEPFDFVQGPLLKVKCCLDTRSPRLFLMSHHIVCDGWSLGLAVRDLCEIYNAVSQNRVDDLPAKESYMDYARTILEQAEEAQNDRLWWSNRLKQSGSLKTVLELPCASGFDRTLRTIRSYSSARVDRVFSSQGVARVRECARKLDASPFHVLLASWFLFLHRISKEQSLAVGVPVAGQAQTGWHEVFGQCVNTLPVSVHLSSEMSFAQLVHDVKGEVSEGLNHASVSYSELLSELDLAAEIPRIQGKPPLLTTLFNFDKEFDLKAWQNPHSSIRLVSVASVPRKFENFELFVNVFESGPSFCFEMQYGTAIFDEEHASVLLESYLHLLRQCSEGSDQALVDGSLLDRHLRHRFLIEWNQGVSASHEAVLENLFPRRELGCKNRVVRAIEHLARAKPDAPALTCGDSTLSRSDLQNRVETLAQALAAGGVRQGDRVGVHLERHPDCIATLLAIWKLDATYVPIDPGFPEKRKTVIVADAQLAAIVIEAKHEPLHFFWTNDSSQSAFPSCFVLCSEGRLSLRPAAHENSESKLRKRAVSAHEAAVPAYILFTSGSTGRPKGVVVGHPALENFLASMAIEPGLLESDVWLAVTTISFDISILELFLPLCVGARLVLASQDDARDAFALEELLTRERVTVMQATPATWRMMLDTNWQGAESHSRRFKVLCGGEPLPHDLASALLEKGVELWNMYGPTETTIWSTCKRIDKAEVNTITVGKPILGTVCHVLDEHMQPVLPGMPGELWIGGIGVADGYFGRSDLTQERFLSNALAETLEVAPRLYRTGDRARYLANGELEILGRSDTQVKVRGYRIELGDIEAAARTLPAVEESACQLRDLGGSSASLGGSEAEKILVLWVKRHASLLSAAVSSDEFCSLIAKGLRDELPSYMVPQRIVEIDSFPLTPNLKIDRRALALPEDICGVGRDVQPKNDDSAADLQNPHALLLRNVTQSFAAVLGKESLDPDDHFFSLGGHSILAVRLVAALKKDGHGGLRLRDVFDCPTPRQLTALLQARVEAAQGVPLPPDQPEQPEFSNEGKLGFPSSPLTIQQKRMLWEENLFPGTSQHNLPTAFRLHSRLSFVQIRRVVEAFVRRHDALQAAVDFTGDEPRLNFHAQCPLVIQELDVEKRLDFDLTSALDHFARAPFDLERAPLARFLVVRVKSEEWILGFCVHHLVFDGWSFDILTSDLSRMLGLSDLEGELTHRPLQFSACLQNHGGSERGQGESSASDEENKTFWSTTLRGTQTDLLLPGRLIASEKEPDDDLASRHIFLREGAETAASVREFASVNSLTPFSVYLGAYAETLFKLSQQNEVLIGTPVRGRHHVEEEEVVGYFVKTIVLRLRRRQETETAVMYIRDIQSKFLDASSHEDVPIEWLSQTHPEIFSGEDRSLWKTFFSYQDARSRLTKFGNFEAQQINVSNGALSSEWGFWIKEGTDHLVGEMIFRPSLYPESVAAEKVRLFRETLDGFLGRRDISPTMSTSALLYQGVEERDASAWSDLPQRTLESLLALNQKVHSFEIHHGTHELLPGRRVVTWSGRKEGSQNSCSLSDLTPDCLRLELEKQQPAVTRGTIFIEDLWPKEKHEPVKGTRFPEAAADSGEDQRISNEFARIWKGLLKLPELPRRDANFFAQGGHSLMAMTLLARVRREWGVRLTPREVTMNSFAQLAALIEKRVPTAACGVQSEKAEDHAANSQPAAHAVKMAGSGQLNKHRDVGSSSIQRMLSFHLQCLGRDDRFLVHFHPAASLGGAKRRILVIAGPGPRERQRSQWALRQLALKLQVASFDVYRFDPLGCGDSSGDGTDFLLRSSFENLIQVIEEALEQDTRDAEVVLLGVRLGALSVDALMCDPEAYLRPSLRGRVSRLSAVYWDPVVCGFDYLESLKVREKVRLQSSRYELKKPQKRASHLLELLGEGVSEQWMEELKNARMRGAESFEPSASGKKQVTFLWTSGKIKVSQSRLPPELVRLAQSLRTEQVQQKDELCSGGATWREIDDEACNWDTCVELESTLFPHASIAALCELIVNSVDSKRQTQGEGGVHALD